MNCLRCFKDKDCEIFWNGCCSPNIGSPLCGNVQNDLLYCVPSFSLTNGRYCFDCIFYYVTEGLVMTQGYQCKFCGKFENITDPSSFCCKRIIKDSYSSKIFFWKYNDDYYNFNDGCYYPPQNLYYIENVENPDQFKSCNTDWAHIECIVKRMDPSNSFSKFLLNNIPSLHHNVTDIITSYYFPSVVNIKDAELSLKVFQKTKKKRQGKSKTCIIL